VKTNEETLVEYSEEITYRQSFHRFCDNMCGELLILPINDKIRLKCVSKQIQRCLIKKANYFRKNSVFSRNNFKEYLIRSVGLHLGRKVQIFNLRWRRLIKVLKKFKFINEIRITKTRLFKMARKNALQIINAFCHQIKSMEFKF
jgi:hypothetical protein